MTGGRTTANEHAPPVHVLVLNWNGWRDTLECLESVFRVDYPNLRVIVCDNASTDGSVERIREWAGGRLVAPAAPNGRLRHLSSPPVPKPIAYVEYERGVAERGGTADAPDVPLVLIQTGANLGFAGGNNVGLRYLVARWASGYVWLLNNDIVVAPDSLRKLVEVIEQDEGLAGVGATLFHYDRPDIVQSAGGGTVHRWQGFPLGTTATNMPRGSPEAVPRRLDFLNGGCVLTRVSTVADVGLIDERFFLYCDDIDWSLRARARGLRLAFRSDAEVWHKGGQSIGHRSPTHDYHLVKSALLVVHKFNPALLPAAVLFSVYRCVLPKVVRGQWERVRAVGRAYRDFVRQARENGSIDLPRA